LRRAGRQTLVIPAMELTTFWGHANALGIETWLDWRVRGPAGQPAFVGADPDAPPARAMAEAAAEVHARGGLFVVNHPCSTGYPACTGCRWDLGDESAGYADVVEVMNGAWARPQNTEGLALWDRWLNAGARLPAVAGTDSHGFTRHPEDLGFTFVLAQRSVAGILDAVRTGRTYLSRGPSLVWLDPLPAAALRDDTSRLGVRLANLRRPVEVVLVAGGHEAGHQRISGDMDVWFEFAGPAASGRSAEARWWRVEVRTTNSAEPLALTNPIWRATAAPDSQSADAATRSLRSR
jgi:hypothetical protein